MKKIAILGTGSWATGLARVLTDNDHDVLMYGIDQREIDDINLRHCNYKYFKNVRLNERIKATISLEEALENADYILITIPTCFIRTTLEKIKPLLKKKVTIINASKGFDFDSNMRISETIRSVLSPDDINAVVSLIGPSHAEEVVVRMLTAICAVSEDEEYTKDVQELFSNDYLRVYTLNDEIGAEYGAAYKNAIAVASGIIAGLGYGDNARAALITRGLVEMTRYGVFKGGQKDTFVGLTGLGDLVVTCSSKHSRNFQAGYEIGTTRNASNFMTHNTKTCEGVRTAKIIHEDSDRIAANIETPIVDAVYTVLYENGDPQELVKILMSRELKSE